MAEFEPGSEEFIQEAARRALSSSELGHVLISDATEGARFTGRLGDGDRNAGDYLDVKTFKIQAGDEFGVMLAANHSIEEVYAGRTQGVSFSMNYHYQSSASPESAIAYRFPRDVSLKSYTELYSGCLRPPIIPTRARPRSCDNVV